jgi:hypothetical protein
VTTRLGGPTTAISLARVSGTIAFGAPFVLSATVTPTQATGILTFSDAVLGVLGSAPVRSGVATLGLTMSAAGTHLTYAGYALSAGDSSHAACISEGTQIAIAPARTATTLSLAQSTVAAGLPVEFNVQVTTLAESIPTGMVEIRMGNRVLASALVHALPGAGFITLAVPSESLGTGDFAAFAAYRGDTNDDGSSCAASAFNVLGTPTATMLSLSAGQVALSIEVRVQVNVLAVGQSATPAGSASFIGRGCGVGGATQFRSGSACDCGDLPAEWTLRGVGECGSSAAGDAAADRRADSRNDQRAGGFDCERGVAGHSAVGLQRSDRIDLQQFGELHFL